MHIIEWQDSYSVNVKLIDDQHKHFVGILNKLYETLQLEGSTPLPEILKDLKTYMEVHFSTEEKYFKDFDYENSSEHIKEHNKLRATVEDFLKRENEPLADVGFELLDFLEDWLVQHVAEQDKKYSKCFNEHGLK